MGEGAAASLLGPGAMVDHFRVLRSVGRGGMGEVYLARDTKLGRKVALKLVLPHALGNAQAVARFLEEARTTARFSHPHIVTVYAAGETQVPVAAGGDPTTATPAAATTSCPYVALEFLDGQTLRNRMQEKAPSPMEAARLGLAIAQALAEAHRHGVLHRDLKPENVMIAADGRLRVLDFGLAKTIDAGAVLAAAETADLGGLGHTSTFRETIASAGALMGTPMYMAPEQWTGLAPTEAIDVWALGMVLHELLGGQHPYEELALGGRKKLFAFAAKVCGDEPVPGLKPARSMPAALVTLVERCVAKSPDARPKASEVASELERLLGRGQIRLDEDESPFRGLLPFTSEQAALFFGRDAEIAQVLERLRAECVLPVVGPSGAGKSSFVLAGLVPRLRETGRWIVLEMRPGRQPFKALATSIARARRAGLSTSGSELGSGSAVSSPKVADGSEDEDLAGELAGSPALVGLHLGELAARHDAAVLLVVDQLEELHTLVSDEAERRAFLAAVCAAADDRAAPVRVILTLRDDFLGRIAEGSSARDALGHVIVLRSPEPEALREVLEKPAQAVGYSFEDAAIVEEMVAAVKGEAAALALLQLAAEELWERRDRDRRLLTRESFDAMGGMEGALARRADRVLEGLSPAEVQTARLLFLRLVTAEGTRRTMPRSDLLEGVGGNASAVLERLVQGRMVLTRKRDDGGEAEIELVHESLLRAWRRLARWIDESREDLAALAEFDEAARLWHKRGCRDEELWQGEALAEAARKANRMETIPGPIRQFLDAARGQERRRARQKRAAWASAVVVLAAIALVLVWANREARRQRDRAEAGRAEALRESAVAAWQREDCFEARAKLRSAFELGDSTVLRSLWWSMQFDSRSLRWSQRLPFGLTGVAYLQGRDEVATAGGGSGVALVGARDGAVRLLQQPDTEEIIGLSASPDGTTLATGDYQGRVLLWDVGSARARELSGITGKRMISTKFSPDGQLVAAAGDEGRVYVWELPSGKLSRAFDGGQGGTWSLAFSPSGRILAAAGRDGTLRMWEVGSWTPTFESPPHEDRLTAVAFSPSGLLVAAGGYGPVAVWDVAQKRRIATLTEQYGTIYALVFSPDGRSLLSSSFDGTVALYDTESWRRVRSFRAHHGGQVRSVALSSDGLALYAAGSDNHLYAWQVRAAPLPPPGSSLATAVTSRQAALSATGELVAGASDGSDVVVVWDARTGTMLHELRGHRGGVNSVAFSPAGTLLATGGEDWTVRLWDARSGLPVRTFVGHGNRVMQVAFSPDAAHIVSASSDKTVRIWDTQTGGEERVLAGARAGGLGVAFDQTGERVAASFHDSSVHVWSWRSAAVAAEGTLLGPLAHEVTFDPESKSVLALDGAERPWRCPAGHGDCSVLEGEAATAALAAFTRRGSAANGLAVCIAEVGDSFLVPCDSATGKAKWRAPVVVGDPPEVLTHLGWLSLGQAGAPTTHAATAWRQATERHAAYGSASGDHLCLGTDDGHVQSWEMGRDAQTADVSLGPLRQVAGGPLGCIGLTEAGVATWVGYDGQRRRVGEGIRAVAWHGDEILLATDREAQAVTTEGAVQRRWATGPGLVAAARVYDQLVLGYRSGVVEVRASAEDGPASTVLEQTPPSPISIVTQGVEGSVVVGFRNGTIGLWGLADGKRWAMAKLNGSVAHALLLRDRLYVAASTGDHAVLDLSLFTRPYCQLLREIWQEAPIVWEGGRAIRKPPPADHVCAQR